MTMKRKIRDVESEESALDMTEEEENRVKLENGDINGVELKTEPDDEIEDGEDEEDEEEEEEEYRDEEVGLLCRAGMGTSREFDVLDEVDATANDNEEVDSDNQSDGSYDSEVPDEEIDAMLEEGLPEEFKGTKRRRIEDCYRRDDDDTAHEEREKVVLEEKGHNHFEVLPEGWVQVTHNSGMPIYLQKQTRVCTLSKPYFLGPGSVRKHEIPLSAIPCLQYQKALEQEDEDRRVSICPFSSNGTDNWEEEEQKNPSPSSDDGNPEVSLPSARIETAQENKAAQSLDHIQVRKYCQRLFKFKTIKVLRFKSWTARRRYTKQKKHQKQLQRPTLPEGTKLIMFPIQSEDAENTGVGSRAKKEWIMNPNGKSYVCILHEYVQHALKKQPCYQFKELENAASPYAATVIINAMKYGTGYGSSKKQAKLEAAKATLEILIPEMREKIREESGNKNADDTDLSFFDEVKIEDPRVAELCAKTSEPSPYSILLTCLQRNFGLGDMHIKYEVSSLKHQKNEFTMTVGKHTAKVICKNKRDGKQRASQAVLQALHPHITSWGSLLRLYGNRSVKSIKEKKQEEQEITLLQSKASMNSPNFAILNKLRMEMHKLKEMKAAVQPIGKFIPPDDVGMPTSSGVDLKNVDL